METSREEFPKDHNKKIKNKIHINQNKATTKRTFLKWTFLFYMESHMLFKNKITRCNILKKTINKE